MKRYRITYNPYLQKTQLEEYFSSDSNPWSALGGEDQQDLYEIIEQPAPIQQIGFKLVSWIEKHHMEDNSGTYVIDFSGTNKDYQDMSRICESFKQKYSKVLLEELKLVEPAWDNPNQVQKALEAACNEIMELYSDGKNETLFESLAHCIAVQVSGLNVLVLGSQNSGKSTLINALLGINLLPVSSDVETSVLYTIKKGSVNSIAVATNNGAKAIITFEKNGLFGYDRSSIWLDRIIDNIKNESSQLESDLTMQMKRVLQALNDKCKSDAKKIADNNKNNGEYIKEIIISLVDFHVMGSKEEFIIKDFPGANAKHLGAEHSKIINDEIAKSLNAMTIYVLKTDDVSKVDVQDFLDKIRKIDTVERKDLNNQIDFTRSIYVLNKADADRDPENTRKAVEREFKDKKVVLTSAAAALEFVQSEEIDDDYIVKFIKPISSRSKLTDLQERAVLPVIYENEHIENLVSQMTDNMKFSSFFESELGVDQKNQEMAMQRTGMPLVAALLEDYAINYASVHKVNCYYIAIRQMMERLNEESLIFEQALSKEVQRKEVEQRKIKKQLQRNCDDAYEIFAKGIVKENTNTRLNNEFRGELEKIDTKIKTQVHQYFSNKETKKNWTYKIAMDINDAVDFCKPILRELTYKVQVEFIDRFKGELLQAIKAKEVEDYELASVRELVRKYETKEGQIEEFEVPNKFEVDLNLRDILKRIIHPEAWTVEHLQGKFGYYWSVTTVVNAYSERLRENIKSACKELNDVVKAEIEKLSPELKEIQKAIDHKKHEKTELQKKIKQSEDIQKRCESIRMKGYVK